MNAKISLSLDLKLSLTFKFGNKSTIYSKICKILFDFQGIHLLNMQNEWNYLTVSLTLSKIYKIGFNLQDKKLGKHPRQKSKQEKLAYV